MYNRLKQVFVESLLFNLISHEERVKFSYPNATLRENLQVNKLIKI